MNWKQALSAMSRGAKVRLPYWYPHEFISADIVQLSREHGEDLSWFVMLQAEWEEYDPYTVQYMHYKRPFNWDHLKETGYYWNNLDGEWNIVKVERPGQGIFVMYHHGIEQARLVGGEFIGPLTFPPD